MRSRFGKYLVNLALLTAMAVVGWSVGGLYTLSVIGVEFGGGESVETRELPSSIRVVPVFPTARGNATEAEPSWPGKRPSKYFSGHFDYREKHIP
jgi:hypothetical protein